MARPTTASSGSTSARSRTSRTRFRVTDTLTDSVREYRNALGRFASFGDIAAFPADWPRYRGRTRRAPRNAPATDLPSADRRAASGGRRFASQARHLTAAASRPRRALLRERGCSADSRFVRPSFSSPCCSAASSAQRRIRLDAARTPPAGPGSVAPRAVSSAPRRWARLLADRTHPLRHEGARREAGVRVDAGDRTGVDLVGVELRHRQRRRGDRLRQRGEDLQPLSRTRPGATTGAHPGRSGQGGRLAGRLRHQHPHHARDTGLLLCPSLRPVRRGDRRGAAAATPTSISPWAAA